MPLGTVADASTETLTFVGEETLPGASVTLAFPSPLVAVPPVPEISVGGPRASALDGALPAVVSVGVGVEVVSLVPTVDELSATGSDVVAVAAALEVDEALESTLGGLLVTVAVAPELPAVAAVVMFDAASVGVVTDATVDDGTAGGDGSVDIVVESTVGDVAVTTVTGAGSSWSERTCVGGGDSTVCTGVEIVEEELGAESAAGSAAIGMRVVPSAGAMPIVSVYVGTPDVFGSCFELCGCKSYRFATTVIVIVRGCSRFGAAVERVARGSGRSAAA